MSCAKQINVVHPGYLKLTMVEVNGPLVLTELGLKLIETDLEEHSDPEGCVLLHNFVDLFSKEFFWERTCEQVGRCELENERSLRNTW